MTDSPPPSPASILRAQLIVEKAKLANAKAKKAKKKLGNPGYNKGCNQKGSGSKVQEGSEQGEG